MQTLPRGKAPPLRVVSTLLIGRGSNRMSVPIFRSRWRFEGELLLVREDRSERISGVTTGTPEIRSLRSSRTRSNSPSNLQRLRKIGTELSHDVLNPARVPL